MGKSDLGIISELSVVLKITVLCDSDIESYVTTMCTAAALRKNAEFCALCAEATVSLTN